MDALILDGKIATGHLDGSVRLWSGRQKTLVYKFSNLHAEAVSSLCFNAMTFSVISVGQDHSIKLIDYKDNEVLDEQWPDNYINLKNAPQSI